MPYKIQHWGHAYSKNHLFLIYNSNLIGCPILFWGVVTFLLFVFYVCAKSGNLPLHTFKRTLQWQLQCPNKRGPKVQCQERVMCIHAAELVMGHVWQPALLSSIGGIPPEVLETYKLVCTTHISTKGTSCYLPPSIVDIRDVAEIFLKCPNVWELSIRKFLIL